jgi:uncharacterized membrane protein (DUF373 family)
MLKNRNVAELMQKVLNTVTGLFFKVVWFVICIVIASSIAINYSGSVIAGLHTKVMQLEGRVLQLEIEKKHVR